MRTLILLASLLLASAAQAAEPRVLRDQSYGPDAAQRFDVYLPPQPVAGAPLILMVHGGAWTRGDKAMGRMVDNKARHWLAQGYVFVSTNYRMLPAADVAAQVDDIARVLAKVEEQAASWGADRSKLVLMGHSAGAHLAALLAASPALAGKYGAMPWQASVILDSAALDLEQVMRAPHLPLYNRAFGRDPANWAALSPLAQLKAPTHPLLIVCSSRRNLSCPDAHALARQAVALGGKAQVLEQNLSHREINENLGLDGPYTAAVDAFLSGVKR